MGLFGSKPKDSFIDRVKYDGPADTLVWRWPYDNLSWATRVIVNQSQEAIFYKGGASLDVLGPGTHSLSTGNIPLLEKLINIPYGNQTPFTAEIYYVNKSKILDGKWGTPTPMKIRDPETRLTLSMRAFGQFGVQIKNSQKFVSEIVGTVESFTKDDLTDYFKGIILTKAQDRIAEVLVKENIPFDEVSAYLDDISKELQPMMEKEFEVFGVKVVNFLLTAITPVEDETYKKMQEIKVKRAEMDLLGDDRYRTVRGFDVMEEAAGNEGSAGGAMGMGMGMGMGVPMGNMMGNMMSNNMPQTPQQKSSQPAAAPAGGVVQCGKCHATIAPNVKFCGNCGEKVEAQVQKSFCGNCGKEGKPSEKFCSSCGNKF